MMRGTKDILKHLREIAEYIDNEKTRYPTGSYSARKITRYVNYLNMAIQVIEEAEREEDDGK